MKKKIRYIKEIYTDKYRSLYQAIIIDTWLDEKSNGLHSKQLRASINPNLTVLLSISYLTDVCEVIKEELLGDDVDE